PGPPATYHAGMASARTRRDRLRSALRGWTVRTRVLSTMLAFMAVGLAVTGVLTYAAQFTVLEERIQRELQQEIRELDLIAQSTNEDGSYVYSSVDELLATVTDSA